MAFLRSSRYAKVELVQARSGDRIVTAVKLRPLPVPPPASEVVVDADDRLDTNAHAAYGDATRGWHVADANTELDARALATPGRRIRRPEQP
jgi:hypothetical protein